MRCAASLLCLVAIVVGAHAATADERPAKPQPPATFLRQWVGGTARFEMYTSFHNWASNAHRADSEAFEVALKALAIRRSGDAQTRRALARDLVRRFEAAGADARTRVRVLHVLGRIAATEGLELLVAQSRAKDRRLRVSAIRALGFFGNGPARESFLVYGGRLRYVVQRPAARAAATQALLAVIDGARTERPSGKGGKARTAFRQHMGALADAITEAVRAHRSQAVAEKLIELAKDPGALRLGADTLAETLALCARHDGVAPLVRALATGSPAIRILVAQALGLCARKEAVKPLLALLAEEDAAVAAAAQRGLMRLAGEKTTPSEGSAASWAKRLGPAGERFDASRADAPRDLSPGAYKHGA